MHVLIVSNKYVDDQNKELDREVRDMIMNGWKVESATTTTTYMTDQRTISWNGVLYTTTIVFSPVR